MISFYSGPEDLEVPNQSTLSSNKLTDVTEVVPTTWRGTTQSTQKNYKPDENNVVSSQKITYISFGLTILLLVLCFVLCFWWSHRKSKIRWLILVTCASYWDWALTWFTIKWDSRVKSDHRSKFSNLSNWKEEAWKKNQGLNGIWTRDLRDTGAMLYQLSYEAKHWEQGQFIEFISSRAVKWCDLFHINFTKVISFYLNKLAITLEKRSLSKLPIMIENWAKW